MRSFYSDNKGIPTRCISYILSNIQLHPQAYSKRQDRYVFLKFFQPIGVLLFQFPQFQRGEATEFRTLKLKAPTFCVLCCNQLLWSQIFNDCVHFSRSYDTQLLRQVYVSVMNATRLLAFIWNAPPMHSPADACVFIFLLRVYICMYYCIILYICI